MVAEDLLHTAEQHLERDQLDDALRLAEQVRDQESKKPKEAEAIRIIVCAQRGLAERKGEKPDAADRMADEALERYREEGDRRSEALILFALAEINSDRRGAKRRMQAKAWAEEAVDIFGELEESRFEASAWLELSSVAAKDKDRDGLLRAVGSAMALFAELQDKRGLGICHHKVASANQMAGDYKSAFEKANKALSIFREIGDGELEVGELRVMSTWWIEQEKPEQAIPLAREALKISRSPEATWPLLPALVALLNALLSNGQAADASQAVQEEVERCMSSGDQVGQLTASECAINVNISQKLYSEALDHADHSLDLARALGDRRAELRIQICNYEIYYAKNDLVSSMESAQIALTLAKELGDSKVEAKMVQRIAHLHFCNNATSDAVKSSDLVKDMALKREDKAGEGVALMLKHGVHASKGELDDALSLAMEAQEVFHEIDEEAREALAWHGIASVHTATGKHDAALFAQEKSLALWKQVGNNANIVRALFAIGDLQLVLKDHKAAEQIVLKLGRYTHVRNKDEVKRQLLFSRTCLLAREEKGQENPRFGGEMLDKALRAVNKAIKLADEEDVKILKGNALVCRAEVLMANGMLDKAIAVAEVGKKELVEANDEAGESFAVALAAEVCFAKGEVREATRLAEDAVQLAHACSDWRAAWRAGGILEKIQETQLAANLQQQQLLAGAAALAGGEGLLQVGAGDAAAAEDAPVQAVAKIERIMLDPINVGARVIDLMRDSLAMDDDEDIYLDTEVLETGLDSLSSMELVSQLTKEYTGLVLSPTLLFDFPTMREVGEHIAEASNALALEDD